jgi:hypothetical protein
VQDVEELRVEIGEENAWQSALSAACCGRRKGGGGGVGGCTGAYAQQVTEVVVGVEADLQRV